MGGNKSGAKRKERRRKKQNNLTEADPEKEDGAQARMESATDSLETHATSTRENTADCEDVAVPIREEQREKKSREEQTSVIQPSGDLEIDKSLAAGSFLPYTTPTTPITAPYPILQPENRKLCLSFRDIGIVVQAMDNNIRGLQIKALAESIYTRPRAVLMIEGIIHDHALKRGQEKVSDDLRDLTEFSEGIIPLDQTILLDMFKRASDRFIWLTECQGLDRDVLAKLLTQPSNQPQLSHEFSDKDKKEILSFVVCSTAATGHVIRVWIEEILDKAELTTSQLTYLLGDGRKIHGGVVNKHWSLKHLVLSMVKIRNSVVHRNFKFINDEEREFLDLYKKFIREMHLPAYFKLKDAKMELDRYLQLEATSKDFENIVECYNQVVERCRASEDERRELKKEICRLENLGANYLQKIFCLEKRVADLVEANMELKRKCTCSKDASTRPHSC